MHHILAIIVYMEVQQVQQMILIQSVQIFRLPQDLLELEQKQHIKLQEQPVPGRGILTVDIMNKKRRILIIIPGIILILGLVLLLIISIWKNKKNETAESEELIDISFEDTYHFDTDWQYYMSAPAVNMPKIQETENGCVFVHNGFIYTYTQGGSIMPLCSKVNCLHDQEPDPEKRCECHACLDDALVYSEGITSASLMAYKDSLYVVYETETGDASEGNKCLARLQLDGSSKEVLLNGQNMEFPIIHRGYIYYFSWEYNADNNEISTKASFHRMNIEKKNFKDELIFSDGKQHGFSGLQAYGSFVYYFMINEGDVLTQVYDIRTGKIIPTDLKADQYLMYRDKLYCMHDTDIEDNTSLLDISEMDITGKKGTMVITGIEPGSTLLSDPNYLYLSNTQIHLEHPEIEEVYKVYDWNYNLVDTYRMPDIGYPYGVSAGGENFQYQLYTGNEEDEWGLLIFDKKQIGSIQGGFCPYNVICYGEESQELKPYQPESAGNDSSDENRIPEPRVNQEVTINYSEIVDELFTGKLERKRYADTVSQYDTECQVSFDQDQVNVSVISLPMEVAFEEGEIVLGTCTTKKTTVYGYYTKGNNTYVRKITMNSTNTTDPDTISLTLPEGADEFIGVKAEVIVEREIEHWHSAKSQEEIINPEAPSSIDKESYYLICYDGKVFPKFENEFNSDAEAKP